MTAAPLIYLRTLAALAPCIVVAPRVGVEATPWQLFILALCTSLALDIVDTLTPIVAAKLRRALGRK